VFLIRHGQTEFNRVFSVTRRDPGIRDSQLTETGRLQAAAIARALRPLRVQRLSETWSEIAAITHWGFIGALTGLKILQRRCLTD
jgi:broad specificity phosphatase PhoE